MPKTPADDHRAVDAEESDLRIARPWRSIGADGRESDAHHHRQPDADAGKRRAIWISVAMPQANRSALIRIAICCGGSLSAPPDDQRHRDGAGVHHQHVLQAEREKARIWQNFVYWVYGL